MNSERAETYLRNLAESELRRLRGGATESIMDGIGQVRAMASTFAQIGVLDRELAESIVDDLTTALELRSEGNPEARSFLAYRLHAHSAASAAPVPAGPVSVTPAGALLELRDGETDMDVYLLAAIRTPTLTCLSTGIQRLPKGSRPRRRPKRALPRQVSRQFPGWLTIPGVPADLIAVDDTGRSYDLVFGGGGDGTWSAGQFTLPPNPRRPRPSAQPSAAWLDVGNDENSVRIDLTARPPAVRVTTTPNGLGSGEGYLRVRAEALLTNVYEDITARLPALVALVQALQAAGALPDESTLPGLIAALCDRYAVSRDGIADLPAELPDRWASILPPRDRPDSLDEPDHEDQPPGAAHLSVTFPEVDGATIALNGVTTRHGTTLHGAFFGVVEEGYPDGPCLWLRDDTGQWHIAAPGNWGDSGVIVFAATVIPPLVPSVTSVDILVVGRTADVCASVPLTWWTS